MSPVSTSRFSRNWVPAGVFWSLPIAWWQLAAQVERRIGNTCASKVAWLSVATVRTPLDASNGSL
jgi:hypothetical protein